MELDYLKYVIVLGRHLNYSRAAEELYISQPCLSQRILQIENEFDVQLFKRKTHSVSLTTAGQEFILEAEKVVEAYSRLQAVMRNAPREDKINLRIGTLLNMENTALFGNIEDFKQAYPHICVTVTELVGSIELVESLEDNLLDVIFFTPSKKMKLHKRISLYPIVDGQVVAIMPRNMTGSLPVQLSLEEALSQPLIFPVRACNLYDLLMQACRKYGIRPNIAAQYSKVATAIDMVRNGIGTAFISSFFASEAVARAADDTAIVPLAPHIARNISLAYMDNAVNQETIELFKDFIEERRK